jgi:putative tricarboxylic transport membrane protein
VKKFAIAATALALAASTLTAVPANAAAVPASKAVVLSECSTLNQVAKGKGADGSDLKCLTAKVGSMKGKKVWSYPTLPVLSRLEMIVPGSATSGYGGFGKAVVDALKAEGLAKTEPAITYKPGTGNVVGLTYMIKDLAGKAGKIGVTGFAQVGGTATVSSYRYRVSDATPIARIMREYSGIAVKADSKYTTLAQLVADIKADPKSIKVVGGNKGGVDHYLSAKFYDTIGVPVADLNYTVNNGGQVAALISDANYTFAVSSYADLESFEKAGKIRILAQTSATKIPGTTTKTFKEQGVNLVLENWRGLILPPNTSPAGKTTVIRALDIMVNSASFKAYLTKEKSYSFFMPAPKFTSWLKTEETRINNLWEAVGFNQ